MSRPLRVRLESEDGKLFVTKLVDSDSFVIGRDAANCDIAVGRPDVSRAHVRIVRGIFLFDLDSTNGTHVDGKRIPGQTLIHAGPFQIGDINKNPISVYIDTEDNESADVGPELTEPGVQLSQSSESAAKRQQRAMDARRDFSVDLATVKAEIEKSQREVESARIEFAAAAQDLESERKINSELRSTIASAQNEIERSRNEAKAALDRLNAARLSSTELERSLREQIDRLEASSADLRGDIARLGSELCVKQELLEAREMELRLAQEDARAQGKRLGELSERLTAIQSNYEASARDNSRLRSAADSSKSEVLRLRSELEATRASVLEPSLEVEALRKQNSEHVDGLVRTRAELEEARARSESTERELAELRQQGLELVRDLSRRHADLDGARSSLLDAQREVATLRTEQADLMGELARTRAELDSARANAAKAQASDESAQRIRALEQRITSLKEELAAKEAQAGAGPQVQLLSDEVAKVRARAEGLTVELERTRAELAAARGGAPAPAGPKPSAMASAMIEQLTRRTRELEAELARARGGSPSVPPEFGGTDLRPVVEDLRRQLDEARRSVPAGAGSSAAAAPASDAALAELREENRRLSRDLMQARTKLVGGGAPTVVVRSGVTIDTLRRLVEEDSHAHGPLTGRSVEDFLVAEQYLGFRNFERVVAHLAKEFEQIFNEDTILPDTEGASYRLLVEALLAAPEDEAAREALASYVDKLGLWLTASVQAHRRAALRYFEVLKSELSEAALTKQKSIVGLGFMVRAELWTRAQQHLGRQSAAQIGERLEAFAREEARAIVSGPRDGA